ncbi:Fe-S cluster assembly protein SufD [Hahella sp. SMD15-11]|uniref:Fe-S cluster assembly protein SufD n=1 Tax=Thermohahella caldifontis TaxID=3142973 RepID=A0AB39UWJ3_9GAMM
MNAPVLPQDALREHIQDHARLLAQTPDSLEPLRHAGREALKDRILPNRKLEAWRYTSIFPLVEAGALRHMLDAEDPEPAALSSPNRIVFVNGHLASVSIEDDGVSVRTFDELDDAEQQAFLETCAQLHKVPEHPMAVVNQALLSEALLIEVDDSVSLQHPLVIDYQMKGDVPGSAHPRLWLRLGRFARADLIEHFSPQPAGQLLNSLMHVDLAPEARATHTLLLPEADGFAVHGVHARIRRSSHLALNTCATGGGLRRLDLSVQHIEEGAALQLNGVYLTREKQHFDVRAVVDHVAAHCETDELWRGIIADESRAIFNGRIHIHPHAQKTRAEMNNNNLLLSDRAEVDTKPELEIYADDVKCAHGATVGSLDSTALFYFQSRGIDRAEAFRMLSGAFIRAVVEAFPEDSSRDLATTLAESFHTRIAERA